MVLVNDDALHLDLLVDSFAYGDEYEYVENEEEHGDEPAAHAHLRADVDAAQLGLRIQVLVVDELARVGERVVCPARAYLVANEQRQVDERRDDGEREQHQARSLAQELHADVLDEQQALHRYPHLDHRAEQAHHRRQIIVQVDLDVKVSFI